MPQCAHSSCARTPRWWQARKSPGATLDEAWYCSQPCVEAVVRERLADARPGGRGVAPRLPGVRLGALLRHHRACPPEQIAIALEAQGESRMRLGEQLRSMGAVEPHALLRALADQAGVSYLASVDPALVRDAPGGLSLDAVLALRLVPIGAPDGGRIRVAFPAPVPRAALTAFRQQTGWTPEQFLVSDDAWLSLLEHYGTSAAGRAGAAGLSVAFAREHETERAARRLAEVVMTAREASMTDARWGQYVWVRLQGGGAGFDLLLDTATPPVPQGEDTWRAATTSR